MIKMREMGNDRVHYFPKMPLYVVEILKLAKYVAMGQTLGIFCGGCQVYIPIDVLDIENAREEE